MASLYTVPSCMRGIAGLRPLTRDQGSGVYFLCRGNQLVYIGSSVWPFARVVQHKRRMDFTRAYWLAAEGKAERLKKETNWITALNPPQNCFGRDKNWVPVKLKLKPKLIVKLHRIAKQKSFAHLSDVVEWLLKEVCL